VRGWGGGARARLIRVRLPGRGGGFYPGTGQVGEVGAGAGRGRTLNLPWPRGNLGDADYVAAFELARPARLPRSHPALRGPAASPAPDARRPGCACLVAAVELAYAEHPRAPRPAWGLVREPGAGAARSPG